jgi:hypothetical protein
MAIEIELDVGSGFGPPGDSAVAAPSATVVARITDPLGLSQILWENFGTHDPAQPPLVPVLGGSPNGETATFTLPAGAGQAYGIRARAIKDNQLVAAPTNAVYVLYGNGERPAFVGETLELQNTHGRVPDFNRLIQSNLIGIVVSSNPPVDVDRSAASAGASTEVAKYDHKHDIAVAAPPQGIGGGNGAGVGPALALSDHDHTLRTTDGPTDLTIGAVADGQAFLRSGASIVGVNIATISTNTVVVLSPADLPAAVGGVRTLAASTIYLVQGTIVVTPDELHYSAGTVIQGRDANVDTIISDNATYTLRSDGVVPIVKNLTVVNNGAGVALSARNSPSPARAEVSSCVIVGGMDLESVGFMVISGSAFTVAGIVISGVSGRLVLFQGSLIAPIGVDIIAGAIVGILAITQVEIVMPAAPDIGLRVVNQNQAGRGILQDTDFSGAGTPSLNVDHTSNNWEWSNVVGATESQDQGVSVFDGAGAPQTVDLPGAQAWTDIADGGVSITYALQAGAEKFTLNSSNTGELIYNGVIERAYTISGHISAERTGGSSIEVEFGISVNGAAPVSASIITGTAIATFSPYTTTPYTVRLQPGDQVKLQARNVDAGSPTADIDVLRVTMSVVG